MKQDLFVSIVTAAALGWSAMAQPAVPTISTDDARRFVGKHVTMCGRVVTYDCKHDAEIALLDLNRPNWSASAAIGIRSAHRARFGDRFEDELLGLEICATGRMERIDKRHVLLAETPESLTVKQGVRQPVTFAADAVRSCTPDTKTPSLVREVQPRYTSQAMRALVQGRLLLDAVVRADGTVGDVRVIHSLDREHGLDQQAIDATKQWRFSPGTLRGSPVPMLVTVEMTFKLK